MNTSTRERRLSHPRHLVLGIIMILASCSPDGTTPAKPDTTTGSIVAGKGVRVLLKATYDLSLGSGNIYSTALSAQDDGAISWTYGVGTCCGFSTLYRKKFDGQTGKVLTPDGDLKKIIRTDLFTGPDQFGASIRYVQGTGKLYQSTKAGVTGDVPDYINTFNNTFTGPPLVYPDGDVVISSNPSPIQTSLGVYDSQLWVRRKHGTTAEFFQTSNETRDDPDAFWHGGVCYPSDANGAISCLTTTPSKVLVIDMQGSTNNTAKIVGTSPFSGVRIVNGLNVSPTYEVKTSADHAKSVIMFRDSISAGDLYSVDGKPYRGYLYSTFIVNNATHQIKAVVSSRILKGIYRSGSLDSDFDMDGNIYYFTWDSSPQTPVVVIKETAAGPTVFKSEFVTYPTTPHALAVSASGKVYAVLAGKNIGFAVCGLN